MSVDETSKSSIPSFPPQEECLQAGQMKYNAAKPTTEASDKLKFKSLSGPQSLKSSEESYNIEAAIEISEVLNVNLMKEKQLSVYDISLDDSSYVAPSAPQPPKGQISEDHQLPSSKRRKVNSERIPKRSIVPEKEENIESLNEAHGIMLRLGNGARTKPKDKSKCVRYKENITESAPLVVASTCDAISPEVFKPETAIVEEESAIPNVADNSLKLINSASDDKSEKEVVGVDVVSHVETMQNTNLEITDMRDSITSGCSTEGNTRKRRAACSVNYSEPSLRVKMRNEDPHASKTHDKQKSNKKKGKKSVV